MLDWKGEVRPQTIDSPNIIHLYFDKIFNAEKINGNHQIEKCKQEIENYESYNGKTDKSMDLYQAFRNIGKGAGFDGLPGECLLIPDNLNICILSLYKIYLVNLPIRMEKANTIFNSSERTHYNKT